MEKMIPLNDEENKSYEKQKVCYKCKKEFGTDDDVDNEDDNKNFNKFRDHRPYTANFRRAANNICNLRYKTPKKIPVVFHNGSTYDYHFIINQLAKELKDQLKCLGKNTENFVTVLVPIKKNLISIKQLHTDYSLLIVLDLCQPHYQVLLITYLKFTRKNAK